MTEAQIKHMVDRFLTWRLPESFNPDCGITFQPICNAGTPYASKRTPVGTNLLDAEQAKAMVMHMIEGMPEPAREVRITGPVEINIGDAAKIVR